MRIVCAGHVARGGVYTHRILDVKTAGRRHAAYLGMASNESTLLKIILENMV
jgi:hypothetical protein